MSIQDVFKEYSGGGGSWFSLKNDGDSAIVRFLYRDDQDLEYTVIHEVEIDGSTRKVECLEFKGQDCPLCQAKVKNRARMFLQLVDYSDGAQVKVWERGKTFLPEIMSFIESASPIYTIRAKVTRYGKKGDPSTQYKISPLVNDEEQFVMKPSDENYKKVAEKRNEIIAEDSGVVLSRSAEDLKKMVNGTFSLQTNNTQNPMGNNQNSTNNSNNTSNNNPADVF